MNIGKLIGQGRTAEIYEIGNDRVVKLFTHEFCNKAKNAIDYEYHISKHLYECNLPMAKTFEMITHNNRIGIVYERINGSTMMRTVASKPWLLYQKARMLAELHASIHIIPKCNLVDYKTRLIENMMKTDLLDLDTKEKLKEYIKQLPDGEYLCHGDFHPDNVIEHQKKYYVIDWMTACKGTPLSDVARTKILFEYGVLPEEKTNFEKLIINFFRRLFLKVYLKHYIRISSSNIQDIRKWEIAIAAGRLIEALPEAEKVTLVNFINAEIKRI